jgi:HD-GYP domain-containing protein (c-di-GMP phosphodiesterase class II)
MKLAVTVTHPDQPDQELLKVGFELRAEVITRLKQLYIEVVYVDYPDLSDLDRHMAAYLSPARAQVYQQIRDTIAAVQKTAKPCVAFPDYYASTRELVITLIQQGQNAIYLDQMSGKMGANAVAHATAVAHLSLMLGIRLESYLIAQRARLSPQHAREVINLGVAGMLHDIGAACLPEAARAYSRVKEPENEALLAEWRTHPQRGYDMIKGGVEPSAASAVLHHHQHFDGSGFPDMAPSISGERRNTGQRIHVFPRIIAVADLYDRLTVGKDGHRRANIEILHLMRTKYAGWLDPEIMKIVPSIIPPYPPGMKLTLSDGTEAVTVGLRPDNPYRPQVKRIEDPAEMRLASEVLDLTIRPDLKVQKIGGTAVQGMEPEATTASCAAANETAPAATATVNPDRLDPTGAEAAGSAKTLLDVTAY